MRLPPSIERSDGTKPLRFDLDAQALNGPDAVLATIDRLVDRAAEKVHLVTAPAADLLETTWYKSSRSQRAAVLRASMSAPVARRVGAADGPELHRTSHTVHDVASAQHAAMLAFTPLSIWIEDEEADGVFLQIVVEELGGELAVLWKACRSAVPAGVEFRSAGIDTLPARLLRLKRDAEERPVRVLVIHDSDRRWPSDQLSQQSIERVAAACTSIGAPRPHCLTKRAVENYIPDDALAAFASDGEQTDGRQRRLQAILGLSPLHRDHLPLKGKKLPDAEVTEGMAAGHYSLSDALEVLKERGLFNKRPRPMRQLDDFRNAFTADGLRARDGRGELEQILDRIAEVL